MNKTYRSIFMLIKSALTGEKSVLPNNVDWPMLIKIAYTHNIIPLLFYGLNVCGIETPYNENLFVFTGKNIITEQQQLEALSQITNSFSNAKIDHAFLKGIKTKTIYPKSEMRIMSDLDILIKEAQYGQIKPLMKKMGFKKTFEDDNVFVWERGSVVVELHVTFVSKTKKDLYEYFGECWSQFSPSKESPFCYELSIEDELIYMVAHLVKHYRFRGVGLRHFIDVYMFNKTYGNLNQKYIEAQLKKLGFYKFYLNIISTVDCWFNNKPLSEVQEIITTRVLKSGSFGTVESYNIASASTAVQKSGGIGKAKVKEVIKTIFLPLLEMKRRFPVLQKAPILLPFMWIVRWFLAIFRPTTIKFNLQRLKKINNKDVLEHNQNLKTVGL